MKYLKLTIALVFIWTKSYSQVQPPTITVGAFENDTIKNFNTVNDFTQSITNELIKKGFDGQVAFIQLGFKCHWINFRAARKVG